MKKRQAQHSFSLFAQLKCTNIISLVEAIDFFPHSMDYNEV